MPTRKRLTKKARKAHGADEIDIKVPVVRHLPSDLVTHFADGTIVTHTKSEFIISFLQTQHPLAITKEEMQQVEQVESRCIARVVITPHHLEQLISALQTNLEKYKTSQKTSEERSE